MSKNYSGIIFDLDGTLYNLQRFSFFIFLSCLPGNVRYLMAARTTLKSLQGKYFGEKELFYKAYYSYLSKLLNISTEKAETWERDFFYSKFVSVLKKQYKPRHDIEKLVSSFKIPCAVLSDYARIDERLRALDINPEIFTDRIYCGDLGGLKPHPEIFRRTAEKMGIKPSEILVIGDSEEKDGKGAESVGMDFYHVNDKSWPLLLQQFCGGK